MCLEGQLVDGIDSVKGKSVKCSIFRLMTTCLFCFCFVDFQVLCVMVPFMSCPHTIMTNASSCTDILYFQSYTVTKYMYLCMFLVSVWCVIMYMFPMHSL